MKTIKPLKLTKKEEDLIKKQVDNILLAGIFAPIKKIQDESKTYLTNSIPTPLEKAILGNKVFYKGTAKSGNFSGKFTAAVSKELKALGATFNKKSKSYTLSRANTPPGIFTALAGVNMRNVSTQEKIIESLKIENVREALENNKLYESYDEITKELEGNWRKAAKALGITQTFTDDQRAILAQEYTNNMEKYIVSFSEEEIVKLRDKVSLNIQSGARSDQLAKLIQREYSVTKAKSLFLARQETSLLVFEYSKSRNTSAGSEYYIWSDSGDATVRGDHHKLNGTKQRWDSPPVSDSRTGRRAHAGQDFGCRCTPIPVYN